MDPASHLPLQTPTSHLPEYFDPTSHLPTYFHPNLPPPQIRVMGPTQQYIALVKSQRYNYSNKKV